LGLVAAGAQQEREEPSLEEGSLHLERMACVPIGICGVFKVCVQVSKYGYDEASYSTQQYLPDWVQSFQESSPSVPLSTSHRI
jgi:hypothetical protein